MQKIPQKMKFRYRNLLLAALLVAAAPISQAQDTSDWKYREGVHYDRLVPVQGTSSPPDKIEVAEFFWYGCVYCYRMDAYVEEWKKEQPQEVNFINIPALWDPTRKRITAVSPLQAVGELTRRTGVFPGDYTPRPPLLAAPNSAFCAALPAPRPRTSQCVSARSRSSPACGESRT